MRVIIVTVMNVYGLNWMFKKPMRFFFGSSLSPVPVSTGHVAMRTRVRILTGLVITDHWTEALPFFFFG